MAKEGMVPFCNIYSSFMQRAYDQLIHDVAIQKLHIVLCLDRAGLVGEDGVTHHGIFDLACLRPIPHLTIASPMNELDLRNLMYTGLQTSGPFVIRYPRGKGELKNWKNKMELLPIGKGRRVRNGNQLAVLSIGPIGNEVEKAIDWVESSDSLSVAHYDMIYLKPIDEALLHEVGKHFAHIITVENGTVVGGLGTTVMEFMSGNGYPTRIHRIGIQDRFVEHGSIPELHRLCGMDAASIAEAIRSQLQTAAAAKTTRSEATQPFFSFSIFNQ
jgi:1-deoxy-D-xylulose-5-phosphate synthase